eukprot:2978363-Rhodomonas_salina.2
MKLRATIETQYWVASLLSSRAFAMRCPLLTRRARQAPPRKEGDVSQIFRVLACPKSNATFTIVREQESSVFDFAAHSPRLLRAASSADRHSVWY